GRKPRIAADAGARSVDHSGECPAARRGARETEDRGRVESRAADSTEPVSAQSAIRWLVPGVRKQRGFPAGGRRLLRRIESGGGLLGGGGGRRLRQGCQLGAAGLLSAGSAFGRLLQRSHDSADDGADQSLS